MNRKVTLITVIGLFILIMAGCVVKNQSSAHNNIKEGHEINDIYSYNVEDDFKGMKLEINLILLKGKAKFELKDPNGDIQWSGEATSDKPLKEIKNFDKKVGEWILRFKNVDNSGEGKFDLQFNRI